MARKKKKKKGKMKKQIITRITRGNTKFVEALAKLSELEGVLSRDFTKELTKLAKAGKDFLFIQELLVPGSTKNGDDEEADEKPKKKKRKRKKKESDDETPKKKKAKKSKGKVKDTDGKKKKKKKGK